MEPRTPLAMGPEQRYWRRRANRRVRKARLTRGLLRMFRGLLLHAALVAVILFGAGRVFRHLNDSRALDLARIELRGAARAEEPRIRAALDGLVGQNLMEIDLDTVAAIARSDVWVTDVQVRRILPDTLCIELEERSPGALALIDGEAWVVDASGGLIGEVGPNLWEDLPILTGFEGLDEATLELRLKSGVETLRRLRSVSPSFASGISELDVSSADRVTVRTVVPGPRLLLDPRAVERNVKRWLLHRDGIESRVGGANYVDLRWKDRITVMPTDGGDA